MRDGIARLKGTRRLYEIVSYTAPSGLVPCYRGQGGPSAPEQPVNQSPASSHTFNTSPRARGACHLHRQDAALGTLLCARKPELSLGRGDPMGHSELQQLWEIGPQRRGQAQFPPTLRCPPPGQQPHTLLRSQLFPPTAEY